MDSEQINFNNLQFNLYELLDLSPTCTCDEVKKTFRRIIKKFHPDKITQIEELLYYNITTANHILSNPVSKNKYDTWLARLKPTQPTDFNTELQNVKQYFPESKTEAVLSFTEQSNELYKRHGEYVDDKRNISAIYKDKESARNNIPEIKRENFLNTKEFNETFQTRKKTGAFSNQLVKRTNDIIPFQFGEKTYAELKEANNLYKKDSQITTAFSLLYVNENDINPDTKGKLDKYNNMTQKLQNRSISLDGLSI